MEETWARHEKMHKQLWEGLTKLGLEPFVEDPKDRLVTVNTIKVPPSLPPEGDEKINDADTVLWDKTIYLYSNIVQGLDVVSRCHFS